MSDQVLGKLITVIGADISELKKAVQAGNKELELYRKKTETELNKTGELWAKSSGFIKGAIAAFATYKVGSFLKDVTSLAARYETLGTVISQVGKTTGNSADEIEKQTQALQKNGISMLESRNTLIRLMQANISLSEATKLGRVAQDAAVIGNINSSEALGRMIHGIQSAEVEILRNIGLNASWESGYKRFAAQVGKTTDELSQNEKMQARVQEVYRVGANITGVYSAAMETAGKKITSFTRYIEDFKVKMGQAFTPALAKVVDALTESMKILGKEIERPETQEALQNIANVFAEYIKISAQAANSKMPETINKAAKAMDWFGNATSVVSELAGGLFNKLEQIERFAGTLGLISAGIIKTQKQFDLENEGVTKKIPSDYRNFRGFLDPKVKDYPTNKKTEDEKDVVSAKMKREAEQREQMNRSLLDQTKQATLTEYDYKVWALEQESNLIKKKYGENSETYKLALESQKAQLIKINQEKLFETQKQFDEENKMYQEAVEKTKEIQQELVDKTKTAGMDQFDSRRYFLKKETDELRKKYAEDKEMLADISKYYKAMYQDIEKDQKEALEKQDKDIVTMLERLQQSASQVFSSIEDYFVNMGENGKDSIRDFVDAAIKDIKRLLVQMTITDPLRNMLTEWVKGAKKDSGGSSGLGSLFSGFDMGSIFGSSGNFDPFNMVSFDTGGQVSSTGGKKPFPVIAHEEEVIGTPQQMKENFGGSSSGPVTINVMAMDSESAYQFAKRNPQAFLEPFHEALRGAGPTRSLIRQATF